jgi:dihydrodipicolinate synthase/N-acetylneuraminate lyase
MLTMTSSSTALITGIGTAVPTLRSSDGRVDQITHRTMAGRLVTGGATSLLVSGTTGRGSTLSLQDRLDLVRSSAGVVPVICGVEADISQDDVVALAHAGVKALLVAFPADAVLQDAVELLSVCRTNGVEMIAYHHPSVHAPLLRQWWPALRELNVQVKNSDPSSEVLQGMLDAGLSVLVGSSARLLDAYHADGVLSGVASIRFDLVSSSVEGDLDAHAELMQLEASFHDRITQIEHIARLS